MGAFLDDVLDDTLYLAFISKKSIYKKNGVIFMGYTITCSIKDFEKKFKEMVKGFEKQVKFAAANAINDVAFQKVRPKLEEEYKKAFTVRNKSFPKAIYIKKADYKTKDLDKISATVAYKADFMALHAKGGEREPEKANFALTVPIDKDAAGFRFESGKVKGRNKAPELLKYYNEHPIKTKKKSGVKRPFILKSGGTALIIKRDKTTTTKESRKKGNADNVLFAFSTKAKVPKRWDFDKIVQETAEKELPKLFEKRFAEAVKTAK